eukprot:CAMPEP_0170491366 /NCGR_PEP_ID=MMETSP0208-20121228/10879_1 /TAXON_ID=197538 /ORGANISM="Strombidium inclinatum, Strain S3" /LENGTH=98 /DNA_ID=CAMNT_0010766929 /DNA_START=456 /DNA_END=752 /DNA_ORIENTATION=-
MARRSLRQVPFLDDGHNALSGVGQRELVDVAVDGFLRVELCFLLEAEYVMVSKIREQSSIDRVLLDLPLLERQEGLPLIDEDEGLRSLEVGHLHCVLG